MRNLWNVRCIAEVSRELGGSSLLPSFVSREQSEEKTMPAISFVNVHKSFGETHALRGVNLRAELGEIHAIVGENGSGKSTLAKIMSGVISPDSGQVDVLGTHPIHPVDAISAGVATIYQEMMLAEDLTIWENLYAGSDGLFRRRISNREKREKTREILAELAQTKIEPDATVSSLPLSVKQWIVIARAIIRKPKLLLFDESSAALDLEATNRLHGEMLKLKQGGSCVMLVTHRIAELIKIADSATILRDGETVGRLEKEEITEANLLRLMSASEGHTASAVPHDKRVITTAQKPALEAKGIKLSPHASAFDFKVNAGEIVGIAGLDGAGQTEFVRVLAGIQKPSQGHVCVWDDSKHDHVVSNLQDAETAGIVFVSGDRKREGIFPNLSILENFGLSLYRRFSGRGGLIDRSGIKKAFSEEMDRLSIKLNRTSDKITTLSGGNQQKVLIARAFALDPKVIILNDPARGVDIGTKQDLYTHLREFTSIGGAVVYLSSEIEEFFDFADRADVFVNNGIFDSFEQHDISEDKLLAAMFGHRGRIEFDKDTLSQGGAL